MIAVAAPKYAATSRPPSGAIAHGNQPGGVGQKKQRRVGLPCRPFPEPRTHSDAHQEKARPDNARQYGDRQDGGPGHNGRPDFECDKLGNPGAHEKIHGETLQERQALPSRGRADDETKRHDARRHRKPETHSMDKAGPTGFVRRRFEEGH
ncbi:MAG: hypothetical protein WA729_21890 [Pseudolabrys sp.]